MKKLSQLALAVASLISLGSPTALGQNSVPQTVIDKCMKAADFQGCVNVMTGKTSAPVETKITVDLDKIRNTGNSCPSGFAYIGGGYCQGIGCYYNPRGHDYRLGGKGWSCSGGNTMQFKGEPIRATTDERCPLVEPEIGKINSCTNGLSEAEINAGKLIKRYPAETLQNVLGYRADWDRKVNKIKVINAPRECSAYKSKIYVGDYIVSINGASIPGDPQGALEVWNSNSGAEAPVKIGIQRGGISEVVAIKSRSNCTFPETAAPY